MRVFKWVICASLLLAGAAIAEDDNAASNAGYGNQVNGSTAAR